MVSCEEQDDVPELREYRIEVPSLQEKLLDFDRENATRTRRILDFLRAEPAVEWFKSFQLASPVNLFRRTLHRREEISTSVPSPVGVGRLRRRRRLVLFFRKVGWVSIFRMCVEWLKNPMNAALLLWLACVAASGTMLGLLLLGLLDGAYPTKAARNYWIEVNNQVLNALFTLMSLYQHPNLCYHLVMLCRWNSDDVLVLRKVYCKSTGYRPHEWAHMALVLVLLHITCFAQYALCSLYWGFSINDRPDLLENLFFAVGVAAPVFAALYAVYSPLGREYDSGSGEDSRGENPKTTPAKNMPARRALVSEPEWAGGLLDFRDDPAVCCLSFFCTCCVFGWNMERLGFGNMYVHVVTFLLLCFAPFWIFNIAALNIHNYVIGDAIGVAGVMLCACGLMYGGFWRIQMRRRFGLPRDGVCCGSASMADYAKWMFCWPCALAQEVRTGNFYDVDDDSLFRKTTQTERDDDDDGGSRKNSNSSLRDALSVLPIQLPPALVVIQQEDYAPSSTSSREL